MTLCMFALFLSLKFPYQMTMLTNKTLSTTLYTIILDTISKVCLLTPKQTDFLEAVFVRQLIAATVTKTHV